MFSQIELKGKDTRKATRKDFEDMSLDRHNGHVFVFLISTSLYSCDDKHKSNKFLTFDSYLMANIRTLSKFNLFFVHN